MLIRKEAVAAKKEASDAKRNRLDLERYDLDRDRIVGTVAHMFREDIVDNVIKRNIKRKTWETAFPNISMFLDAESFHMLEREQQRKLLFHCLLVNEDASMNRVQVEDVVWALERCKVPILVPASSDEDKLQFLHNFGKEFTFLPEDSADKRLLERMHEALRRHLEREILRADVAAFKIERRKRFPPA